MGRFVNTIELKKKVVNIIENNNLKTSLNKISNIVSKVNNEKLGLEKAKKIYLLYINHSFKKVKKDENFSMDLEISKKLREMNKIKSLT